MIASASTKQIVCLANSRKLGRSCFAGKELLPDGSPGPWVRPVSAREYGEVSLAECRYSNGLIPKVLDLINVPILRKKPKGYQQENWLLDPMRKWDAIKTIPENSLLSWVDPVETLWHNGSSSSNGLNNRFPEERVGALRTSLCLIYINSFNLHVFIGYNGDKSIRGNFRYNGVEYTLTVTDNEYEYAYKQKPVGAYALGACFLTISLGEPFQDYVYKLIAAIIPS